MRLLVPLLLLVLEACGDERDSRVEFVDPPGSRERQGEGTAPRARGPGLPPSPQESSPRTRRIAVWNMPKGDWPLTVREGAVRCQKRDGRAVVTFVTPDAKVYGVNAAAVSQGLPRIDPIVRTESDAAGTRAYISRVLEEGLRLCE